MVVICVSVILLKMIDTGNLAVVPQSIESPKAYFDFDYPDENDSLAVHRMRI